MTEKRHDEAGGVAPRAAVVGAGLSGLSCATALQAAGWQVTVFDKSRGPSGRMSTRRGDGWQCDHGAQYFTARDPDFAAQVAQWRTEGCVAPWQPRLRVWSREAGWSASASALDRWVGVPRMTAPAASLAARLDVRLAHTVTALARDPAGWRVAVAEPPEESGHVALGGPAGRDLGMFDAVMLAVPAPQAVPLLQPVWSEMAGRVQAVRMRGSWALMLQFPEPVALDWDAAFVNSAPLRWVARDSGKPGRPQGTETWLLHADADWSDAHIEDPADAVAAQLLAAWTELGGPRPAAWAAHRWRYADVAEPHAPMGPQWCGDLALGLCGDWLTAGKVEGAWLSGRDLARIACASMALPARANGMPKA